MVLVILMILECAVAMVSMKLFIHSLEVFMKEDSFPGVAVAPAVIDSCIAYSLWTCCLSLFTSSTVATSNNEFARSPTKGNGTRLEREFGSRGGCLRPSICSVRRKAA